MTTSAKELLAPLTASKLPVVYVKGSLRYKRIALDTALAGLEVNMEAGGGADFVFFDERSTPQTGATMTIDDESSTATLPIGPLRGFRDLPCKRVHITCAAVTGGVLHMWYGKGAYLYGQTPQGKGQWYDRSPLEFAQRYSNDATAPHVNTQRWTYTVPANRKTLFDGGYAQMVRDTASGAPALATNSINIQPGGAGTSYAIELASFNGTVNTVDRQVFGGNTTMLAGTIFTGSTRDNSVGGTYSFRNSAHYIEYDA